MSEKKLKKTERGFEYAEFTDYNGVSCSIQKSSLATEDAIWLGCNEADPQHLTSSGWEKLRFPKDTVFITRMHLTREQVAILLPLLQNFVDTGELSKDD